MSDQPHQAFASPPRATAAAVTATVTRRVKPGHEPFYERFLEGIVAAAARFPGYLGVEVFRPQSASAGEYRVVYCFDSSKNLRAWIDFDERAAWVERAEPQVIGAMRTRSDPVVFASQRRSGVSRRSVATGALALRRRPGVAEEDT